MNPRFVSIFLLILACGQPTDIPGTYLPPNLSDQDQRKFQQYLIQGRELYEFHCKNCHMAGGEGMQRLYPPIAKSDYIKNNLDRVACIIRTGQAGSIVVNGIEYNMKMPGIPELTPLEIAEIITYIGNSWENREGFFSVQDANTALRNCEEKSTD